MLASLKRLDIYANAVTHQIRLKMGDDKLQMFAEDIDFSNEAQESILAEFTQPVSEAVAPVEGEDSIEPGLEIGFNARFLQEMLSNLTGEKVRFTFSTPSRASIMLPTEQTSEDEILMLIMPVLINSYSY